MLILDKLKKNKRAIRLLIGIVVMLLLIGGGFFVVTALRDRNIAESETSASDITASVNYIPGEIIISFKTPPGNNTDKQLQNMTQLFDLNIKKQLTDTTFLYQSNTLRDNAFVGINSNNFVNGNWGRIDEGSNRMLTLLNENAPQQISGFEFAEPNFKVELFTE